LFHRSEQGVVAFLVERQVVGVLVELHAQSAQLTDGSDRLVRGGLGVGQGERRGKACEPAWVLADELGHPSLLARTASPNVTPLDDGMTA
jgi:hypothetical protein